MCGAGTGLRHHPQGGDRRHHRQLHPHPQAGGTGSENITVSAPCTEITDNYFYCKEKNEHYLIELKASGDLDNKKARAEKTALLEEYFLLKNQLKYDDTAKVKIFFGTAYNKYGEGKFWKQERVKQFFSEDELLIGTDYWNFVCNDNDGFKIIFEQYQKSADKIRNALTTIKGMYFK